MKRALSGLTIGLLGLLATAGVAESHTRLTSPQPRDDNDGHKFGPCGATTKGSPLEFAAGETIRVDWLETINHPGYYRIALSMAADADFDSNVLADDILDENCTATPCSYTANVTLPSVECEDCTLQLIQYMGTAAPYSPYHSCADLRIGMGVPGSDAGNGGDDGSAGGGCQIAEGAGGSALGSFAFLCLVLGLGAPQRR